VPLVWCAGYLVNIIVYQVLQDYYGEVQLASDMEDKAGVDAAKADWRSRARQYLNRGGAAGEEEEQLEPKKKKHRVKAMLWGLALDNCLMACTGRGLEAFEISGLLEDASSDPYSWPELSVAPDQGTDGMCMAHALTHGWAGKQYNVDLVWDPSHGGTNDIKLTVKAVGLWHHELLTVVAAAAPFSPFGDGTRRVQVQEAMKEYTTARHPETEPLFMSLLPDILAERGEAHRSHEPNIAQELWEAVRDDPIWAERGSKLSLSRFQSVVHHATTEASKWTTRYLGVMYCSMQLGVVTAKLIKSLDSEVGMFGNSSGQAGDEQAKQSTARDEVAKLRRHTVNNLAIATLYYANFENRAKQKVIKEVCAPVLEWHTEQNRKLRSVGEALEWEVGQQRGGWLKHIQSILGKLSDTNSLEAVGLVVPLTTSYLVYNSLNSGEAMFMNQVASLYGDMVVSLAGFRVRIRL
jgi:hypothetical protein